MAHRRPPSLLRLAVAVSAVILCGLGPVAIMCLGCGFSRGAWLFGIAFVLLNLLAVAPSMIMSLIWTFDRERDVDADVQRMTLWNGGFSLVFALPVLIWFALTGGGPWAVKSMVDIVTMVFVLTRLVAFGYRFARNIVDDAVSPSY